MLIIYHMPVEVMHTVYNLLIWRGHHSLLRREVKRSSTWTVAIIMYNKDETRHPTRPDSALPLARVGDMESWCSIKEIMDITRCHTSLRRL